MKVVIAGSRTLTDEKQIRTLIHKFFLFLEKEIDEIVSGCANGVDKIGETYTNMMNIPVKLMPADWNKHGKKAGMVRNAEMAVYCDFAVIFWDGESSGALNMARQMAKLGKPYVLQLV